MAGLDTKGLRQRECERIPVIQRSYRLEREGARGERRNVGDQPALHRRADRPDLSAGAEPPGPDPRARLDAGERRIGRHPSERAGCPAAEKRLALTHPAAVHTERRTFRPPIESCPRRRRLPVQAFGGEGGGAETPLPCRAQSQRPPGKREVPGVLAQRGRIQHAEPERGVATGTIDTLHRTERGTPRRGLPL